MLRFAVAAALVALGAPLSFIEPTSVEVLPDGKLLVVENNPGRLLKVDPRTGRVTVVVRSMTQPYSVVSSPSGAVYVSAGRTIRKVGGGVVARNADQIGPLAAAADGTLYYTTTDALWHGGKRIAGGLDGPHGLAVAKDGAVLVSDTGANRVLRIPPEGATTTFAAVTNPRGLDIARDGTVYVVDATARRIVRLGPDGSRLGVLGPRLPGDPYDVQARPGGGVYVLESGFAGDIRVISARGRMTVLKKR